MKILSLNMNMFNYDINDRFYDYLAEINPDIAIIQECRYNRLNKLDSKYKVLFPNHFSEENVDNRIHFTLILSKNESFQREDIETINKFDYTYLKMISDNNSLVAVHIPYRGKGVESEFDRLLDSISASNATMICGDFNASDKKPNENYRFLCHLIDKQDYINLWNEGIQKGIAYYIDYRGNTKIAARDKFFRTYSGNTHIDYMLGKKEKVNLKSIIIDYRTLSFTDHCSIISDIELLRG